MLWETLLCLVAQKRTVSTTLFMPVFPAVANIGPGMELFITWGWTGLHCWTELPKGNYEGPALFTSQEGSSPTLWLRIRPSGILVCPTCRFADTQVSEGIVYPVLCLLCGPLMFCAWHSWLCCMMRVIEWGGLTWVRSSGPLNLHWLL